MKTLEEENKEREIDNMPIKEEHARKLAKIVLKNSDAQSWNMEDIITEAKELGLIEKEK